jgi:hypothetical protein
VNRILNFIREPSGFALWELSEASGRNARKGIASIALHAIARMSPFTRLLSVPLEKTAMADCEGCWQLGGLWEGEAKGEESKRDRLSGNASGDYVEK